MKKCCEPWYRGSKDGSWVATFYNCPYCGASLQSPKEKIKIALESIKNQLNTINSYLEEL